MLSALHPDDQQARVELAACYRIFVMLGWTEMIYNHITVRLPDSVTGGDRQFLINPFGLHYSEVTASNLVKIDVAGKMLDGPVTEVKAKINPAGFTVHAAIHRGVSDTHTTPHHTTPQRAWRWLVLKVACSKATFTRHSYTTWWRITTLKASPFAPMKARAF